MTLVGLKRVIKKLAINLPIKKQAKLKIIKLDAYRSFISPRSKANRIVNDQTVNCIPTYINWAIIPFLNLKLAAKYFKVLVKDSDFGLSLFSALHGKKFDLYLVVM